MRRTSTLALNERYLLRAFFWLLAILLGAIQTWVYRYSVWLDVVSYLDIGDAYLGGEWNAAINGCWSPLYSLLLGLANTLLKPSAYSELSVVKLVNFIIYVFSLVGFEFFLRELIFYHQNQISKRSSNSFFKIPEWAWIALGYSLFIWSSLKWLVVYRDTPDICVAALVYLAAGIVLRVHTRAPSWFNFIMLGAVLGFGYLAKSVMFPLAFVFLAVTMFSVGNFRQALPRILVALLVFAIISAPFIVALSVTKGRLTFGDAGKLNYAWYVSPRAPDIHWQGHPRGSGTPKHPTRKIFDDPVVYEFGEPVGGTYPPWYDPSYWNEGLTPKFSLKRQIDTLSKNIVIYYKLFLGSLVFGYLILICAGGMFLPSVKGFIENWRLLIPAVTGLGIYMLVTDLRGHESPWGFLQIRYIAPFIVLLFAGFFSSVRLPDAQRSKILIAGLMVFVLLIGDGKLISQTSKSLWQEFRKPDQHLQWQVANSLIQLGIQPGEKVALLGSEGYYWARLAQVKVVADVYGTKSFWKTNAVVMSELFKAVENTGARVIVSLPVYGSKRPDSISELGWKRLGDTDYYAYIFRK